MAHPLFSQWWVKEYLYGLSSRWLITRVHIASRQVQVLGDWHDTREAAEAALAAITTTTKEE